MSIGTKVQLYAFGEKLKSEPFDWPEDKIGDDIYLMVDMEKPSFITKPHSSIKIYDTTTKRARFEFTGGYSMNGDNPAIYVLVEVLS